MYQTIKKAAALAWCTTVALAFTAGLLVSAANDDDDAQVVRANRFIVTAPNGVETAELAALSSGTVRLKLWNQDRSASVWVGVVDNQPAIAITDKNGRPYASLKLEDQHVVGVMYGAGGIPSLRAQVGLEGNAEPSLSLFDSKGTARIAVGLDKLNVATLSVLDSEGHVRFQAASAPGKTAGGSVNDLSLYDADGTVIWRAPAK